MIKICAQEQSSIGELLPLQPGPKSKLQIKYKQAIYKDSRYHGYSIKSIYIESTDDR